MADEKRKVVEQESPKTETSQGVIINHDFNSTIKQDDASIAEKKVKSSPKLKIIKPKETVLANAERYSPEINSGLTNEQVSERLQHGYINKVEQKFSKSYTSIFVSNICTFFNLLGLLVVIALIFVKAPISNFFFALVYVANIVIGIVQEIRAKLTIERLSLLTSKSAKVVRNGVEQEISVSEIVLDDILKYALGNQISTDSIVLEGSVEVNESLLTGESNSIKKVPGDILYAGSYITAGSCYARADKVGKDNYISTLTAKAKKYKKPHSELMHSIKLIITVIGCLIVPMAIAMFTKLRFGSTGLAVNDAVMRTSAVIIGMIPSGMMLLTSIALAVGVIRLSKNQNTLTQDLYSLEMLARVDVLCLDKTGTITDGRMKVNDCILLSHNLPNTINEIMGSYLYAQNDNNQTSIALYNHFGHNKILQPLKTMPFSSETKYSAVTFKSAGTFVLGAPEFVLKEVNDKLAKMIKQYTAMGLRVLLLAHAKSSITDNSIPASVKPVALITITDNIREDAVATINWFKANDVAIKVISGDNPVTVAEIARRVGIENADKYISLEGLSESEVINAANNYSVFGRVSPEQKATLIKALKAAGHTTAMTGDGVNDILALKEADCAISVLSGSEAARNVSNLVLMNNNFSAMPKIVQEGRRVINNIQNSASLYLMKTLFVALLALLTIIRVNATYPFNNDKMILLELFIIGIPSVMLSLQVNNNRVTGNFIGYVFSKAIPSALLMLLSVLFIQWIQKALGSIAFPDENIYESMQAIVFTVAGLIMLYRICQPFNVFRGVLCAIITILLLGIIAYSLYKGVTLFGLCAMVPLKTYWHHLLIMISVILLDIPMSGWLQTIFANIKIQTKKKK